MTAGACVLLPLLVAALWRWLPRLRWLPPGVALATLALSCSLPWTGGGLGGWLLPDPLAVHLVIVCVFAWLAASAAAALDGPDVAPAAAALVAGCINLALLSDGAGLSVAAAGVAVIAAVLAVRPADPQPLVATACCALGLAVFGLAALASGTMPSLGPGWPSLSWSALPESGPRSGGSALGLGFVALLMGLGGACLLLPVWSAVRGAALPRTVLMLAGPLGSVWLVSALRLRGVLDGNGHAVAPGGMLLVVGLAGCLLAPLCLLRRDPVRLVPACIVATMGAALFGFGIGGAGATAAGLLHLTLGCLLLTAAAAGGWPAVLGAASLAVLPPFALFGSLLALLSAASGRQPFWAAPFFLALVALALAALRLLPPARPGRSAQVGWAGFGLALLGAWAMPAAVTTWLHGIAAAAR